MKSSWFPLEKLLPETFWLSQTLMSKTYKTSSPIYFTEQCLPSEIPVLNKLHSLPMTCSDIPPPRQTDMSTNYSLVVDTSKTITQPWYFFDKWFNNKKKSWKDDDNKNRMNLVFFANLLKQPLKRPAQADLTQSCNQSFIYEKKETIIITIRWDYLHRWYHLIHLPFLLPFNNQDDHLFYLRLLLIHHSTLILWLLKPRWLFP